MRMLQAEGLISKEQLEKATIQQAEQGGTIDSHLVANGAISADSLVRFLVRRFPVVHWPRTRLENLPQRVIDSVSPGLATSLRIIPLSRSGSTLVLGLADPSRHHAIQEASHHAGVVIQPVVVSDTDLTWALRRYYPAAAGSQSDEDIPVPLTQRVTREFDVSTENGPHATSTPVPKEVHATPDVPAISATPDNFARTTLPARAVATRVQTPNQPIRIQTNAERAVVVDPIRTIGTTAPPTASRPSAKAVSDERDSWTAPASPSPKPKPRRRASHPLSKRQPNSIAPETVSLPQRQTKPDRPRAITPPPEQKRRSEGELIAAIDRASDRDQIVGLALEHLLEMADRAVFFIVKSNEIRGFDIIGENTSRSAIRSLWIPTAAPSTLRSVLASGQIHHGPLGNSPADAVLSAALGGDTTNTLIMPVVIRSRVIGLLYADRLVISSPSQERLERLARVVGENLTRLLSRGSQP